MKNAKVSFTNIVKKQIETALKLNANNTSSSVIYQPKAPADLKKFSKINSK